MGRKLKLSSNVVGMHKGKPFRGKLVGRMHPLPGIDADILYRVELPSGRHLEVTADEIRKGGNDAEKTE